MEEKKTLEFPVKGHEACPACGCKDKIARQAIDALIKQGELPEGMFPMGLTWATPLVDPNKQIPIYAMSLVNPKIPILQVHWDVCANPDCLTPYVTGVDFVLQEIKTSTPLQAPRNPREFFPRGR